MNAKKGSTLIEMLAVLVIGAIFLALLAPAVYNIATNAPPTAAHQPIDLSADPADSPGNEPIAAGVSQDAGSCSHRCADASAVQATVPNQDANPQSP
jgi:prepilin-type N-terminal cleavage/methylation domain-containing protein